MAEDSQLISFLSHLALFRDLEANDLEQLAVQLKTVHLATGERLFSQGEPGDRFYIIYSGKVHVTRGLESHRQNLATLVAGDFFGEESLLSGRPRTASVTALEPTELFTLDREQLYSLLKTYPYIKPCLIATITSRQLARKKQYSWLGEDETVYLMARKAQSYLLVYLMQPLLVGWLSVPFFVFAFWIQIASFRLVAEWIGFAIQIVALLWGIWRWIDWGNDYYIVTNQRVVWLEKVIGLYDSRQEAPLSTVLTVGIITDQAGRMLGYGDVIVRTFTGQIVMQHVGMAVQLAAIIEEQLARNKQVAKKSDAEALERTIRMRLGLPVAGGPRPEIPQSARSVPVQRPGFFKRAFINFFKMRYEEGGVITFRKHWFLLLEDTWKSGLGLLALAVFLVLRLMNYFTFISTDLAVLIWFTFSFLSFLWWLYEYVDWRNDIYQITSDQIIDIYKKPLGREDKKTALLENILSLGHERKGILGLLFNYGNVIAMVGAARFTFDGVYNPAGVESEIFHAIAQRKRKQKEDEAVKERERIADWLEAYHRQTESIRNENTSKLDQNTG